MGEYLVELYMPKTGSDGVREAAARARSAAAAMRRGGTRVRYVRSIFLPGDETCFYVFEAASADAVREAATLAAIPFERVVEALDV